MQEEDEARSAGDVLQVVVSVEADGLHAGGSVGVLDENNHSDIDILQTNVGLQS